MTKTFIINKGQKPTDEQLQEVIEAKKQPIVFDDDSPELSPAMYKAFKSSVIQRNRKKTAGNGKLEKDITVFFEYENQKYKPLNVTCFDYYSKEGRKKSSAY